MTPVIAEKIDARVNCAELFESIRPLLEKYPAEMRSPAIGGWALQSTNRSYKDGWSLDFCPYNGPKNRGPTWTPQSEAELKMQPVQEFVQPTEILTPAFANLLQELDSVGLNPRRARIIQLMPGASSVWHQDGSKRFYQARLHIPLVTNDGCFFETEDGRYHMAADGSYYFVHINKMHRVVNNGSTVRYHFVVHVWDQQGITQWHQYNPLNNDGETVHP